MKDKRKDETDAESDWDLEWDAPLFDLIVVSASLIQHHEGVESNGGENDERVQPNGTLIGVIGFEDEFFHQ